MDIAHLDPNFDYSTLRVADLRRILMQHDIHFPSAAKKQQLFEIFMEQVVPNAAVLRKQYSVTGTGSDIESAPVTQRRGSKKSVANVDVSDEFVTVSAPLKKKRSTSRKSKSAEVSVSLSFYTSSNKG